MVKCPYCSAGQGRCASTAGGRWITECRVCDRVIEERQTQPHDLFFLRAQDTTLSLVTPDLSANPNSAIDDEDPFEPTGFITAFSTWSLEPTPILARSSFSFSGYLAELERMLDSTSASCSTPASSCSSNMSGPMVSLDHLRAYLQIIDVSSILGLDRDISDHAFQLFRDCSSTTCLRNRNVEALATASLVQAIREAQEPRTLQEISTAANLPQKEIGKYIKILGEALKLSQPINSNSISVHMPRFCSLLQINQSARDLATHIGEVVINKCFCTRRNPISISAAAIYLACQLEDKRKTQAEICKVTGLTEVTLRKVYKELLENWDDLIPPDYTPAIPPEKAFPTTIISLGRSSTLRVETLEISSSNPRLDKDKPLYMGEPGKISDAPERDIQTRGKEEAHGSSPSPYESMNIDSRTTDRPGFCQPHSLYGLPSFRPNEVRIPKHDSTANRGNEWLDGDSNSKQKVQFSSVSDSGMNQWPFLSSHVSRPPYLKYINSRPEAGFVFGSQSITRHSDCDKKTDQNDKDTTGQ